MDWHHLSEAERFYFLQTMLERGGSFASSLAYAWMRADSTNSARLGAAFPDMVERYGPRSDLYTGPKTVA